MESSIWQLKKNKTDEQTNITITSLFVRIWCAGTKKLPVGRYHQQRNLLCPIVYGLRSMKSGQSYTVLKQGQKIEQYAYATGEKEELIFDLKALNQEDINRIDGYQFSADERKILITSNREDIYRHSFSAEFFVYDRDKKTLAKLSKGRQQLADFSPSGNQVCFYRANNLFVKDLKSGKETQFTFDGKYNHIINGAPDWVYEEEFSFWQAYQWSPDGKRIATCVLMKVK